MVRAFAREKVAPRAAEIDRDAAYPHDMFAALRDLGLFALPFPERYGGADSVLSGCLAIEELGRVCYNTAYLLLVQWTPFAAVLAGGSPAQQERWLPGLAGGTLKAAISVTEPQSGSDAAGIRTRAVRERGGYRIDGAKVWCTNSPEADFIVVAAKTDPSARHRGISVFAVEKGTPGLTIGQPERKLGSRGIPSCPLFFDGAFVPEENRIGPEGEGWLTVMEAFNRSRPMIGARGVGLAQGALDLAADYVRGREAFGQPVADFQGVRWMLADMTMRTEAARQMVCKAAALADAGVSGRALAPWAAMAKCLATDAAMSVATDAVQLWGSAGISADNPVERFFRDAKVLQIVEGTNQIQRNIIGRHAVETLGTG
ncbi:MAG: acyl-CoA dehydrogenase [Alphaproteobacteria bacterium]|nr:acyl-CoA dehydrogenase [Alphaproteobacteria bacterium]